MKVLYAVIGSVVTLGIFLAGVIYKMGHHAARLESLEGWRSNIRTDMHEISDKLGDVQEQLAKLTTLIQERTERRDFPRTVKET